MDGVGNRGELLGRSSGGKMAPLMPKYGYCLSFYDPFPSSPRLKNLICPISSPTFPFFGPTLFAPNPFLFFYLNFGP